MIFSVQQCIFLIHCPSFPSKWSSLPSNIVTSALWQVFSGFRHKKLQQITHFRALGCRPECGTWKLMKNNRPMEPWSPCISSLVGFHLSVQDLWHRSQIYDMVLPHMSQAGFPDILEEAKFPCFLCYGRFSCGSFSSVFSLENLEEGSGIILPPNLSLQAHPRRTPGEVSGLRGLISMAVSHMFAS